MRAISQQILKLAVPSILANITIPLVGLVDMAIVGHISDAAAIGGIAVGTMLFDLLYWNFAFLRVGTSGMTAQAYGAEKGHSVCGKILVQSIGIALVGALFLWMIQWAFISITLSCVPCSADVADFARRYFLVRIWAAPATLSLMALKGWFIGMQDTISPMIVDIAVNVVNMLVSYGLAVYTSLGAVGVAYGTVIAQFTGLLIAIGLLWGKYRDIIHQTPVMEVLRNWRAMRKLLVLNGNLFVRSLCFMVVYVGYTSLASRYGNELLAVSGILMKLFMIFSYFVDGFAYAGEALVGKCFGAIKAGVGNSAEELKATVGQLWRWSVGVGLAFTVIYAIWGEQLVLWIDPHIISQLSFTSYRLNSFLPWLIAMPLISTLAFMWDGIYIGATAGVAIRNSMIWAAGAFVVSYICFFYWWGIQAVFVAYFAHLVARVVYLNINWKYIYDREISQSPVESPA